MRPSRKGVRTTRTREDHDLFKISLPSYNPETIESVIILLSPGEYLKPEQPFAKVLYRTSLTENQKEGEKQQDSSVQELSTYLAGTVERLGPSFSAIEGGWKTNEGLKRGSLQLIHVRECQHLLKNQSIENSNNKGNFNLSAGEKCHLCGKQIWVYTSSQEQTITAEQLLKANQGLYLNDFLELEWLICVNQQFTPTIAIAKIGDQELNYPEFAKATYLIGQGEKPALNTAVMKIKRAYCCHEKIIDERCQHCLQQIQYKQRLDYSTYLFQLGPNRSQNVLTKGTALSIQEEAYISSVLQKNKLILILDLDNTILHSNEMSELELGKLLKLKEFFLIPKVQQGLCQDFIIIKMRQFFREFLYIINQLFQVYIYTKGTRIYADGICKWVRAQWAGQTIPYHDLATWNEPAEDFLKNSECFLPYRVISRSQDSSMDTKSMQNILPNRTQYHVILDDRRDVWNNSPSWYFTRQFFYFLKKPKGTEMIEDVGNFIESEDESSPLKEKLIDCYNHMRKSTPVKTQNLVQPNQRPDYFLLFAAHNLKKMHSYFFEVIKKNKAEKKDQKPHPISLATILQRLKLFFLKKKIKFFMTPEDHGATAVSVIRRSCKMGAIPLKQTSTEVPDYVIRSNNYVKFAKEHINEVSFDAVQMAIGDKQSGSKQQNKQVFKKTQMKQESQKIEENRKLEQKVEKLQIKGLEASQKGQIPQKDKPKNEKPMRDYNFQLKQLKNFAEKGIPIMSETWIVACYINSFNYHVNDFRLPEPLKEEINPNVFSEVIAKAGELIKKDILEQMKQQKSGKKENKEKQQKNEISAFPQSEKSENIVTASHVKREESKKEQKAKESKT